MLSKFLKFVVKYFQIIHVLTNIIRTTFSNDVNNLVLVVTERSLMKFQLSKALFCEINYLRN